MSETETETVMVLLDHMGCPPLELRRTPLFLRFVRTSHGACRRGWDALDQLEDEVAPGEIVIVARLVRRGVMFVDGTRNGRRFGRQLPTATYEPLADQPPPEVARYNARWRKWCEQQQALTAPATEEK